MRTRLILLAIILLVVAYWRGIKQVTAEQGLNCEYHLAYAVCASKGKPVLIPGIIDILKAGVKF